MDVYFNLNYDLNQEEKNYQKRKQKFIAENSKSAMTK